jgi:predicted NACHT family NTPase
MNDFSDALVKGAVEGLKEIGKDVVKGAVTLGRKQVGKLSVDFEYGFKDFLKRNYKRLSRVKTLLNPTEPVAIEATYVSPNFSLQDRYFSEPEFLSFVSQEKFVVVTGTGGSGKSIFLKHLFVRHCKEALGRVPLFVELRHINPDVSLLEYMCQQISIVAPAIDNNLFAYALRSGKFILLLDGFDEIDPSYRDKLARQILELSYEFGENDIVLFLTSTTGRSSHTQRPLSVHNERFNTIRFLRKRTRLFLT